VQLTEDPTAAAADSPRAAAIELGRVMRRLFLDPRADHLGAIEERNLTMTQVRTLTLLACADEPAPAGDLADRLGLSPAAMSRALDVLARRHLVTRRESKTDRRVRLVEIADLGRDVVDELVALRLAGLEAFLADIDPGQRRRLTEILAEINADADEGTPS
jgi:DNA-binding MarR family transcriptional regulator